MLRKLLLFSLLTGSLNAFSQTKTPLSKATEKKKDTQIEYTQPGAPMPPLRLIPYYDTGNMAIPNTEMAIKDSIAHKKIKKRDRHVIQDTGKKAVTNADVNNGANLLVMTFNPLCSHCEDETMLFEKNIAYFNRSKLLLLSTTHMREYLPGFIKAFHTAEYPSIIVGSDSSNFSDKVFLFQALPQINIYNADRKLIKTFTGDVEIDSLKEYIQ